MVIVRELKMRKEIKVDWLVGEKETGGWQWEPTEDFRERKMEIVVEEGNRTATQVLVGHLLELL